MSDGLPSDDDIIEALERSGFLMEQEVAITLESLGFRVQTGRAFEDPDEGKSRELDVWAYKPMSEVDKTEVDVGLYLLVQCKNNSNPVVFLTRRRAPSDSPRDPIEYVFPVRKVEVYADSSKSRARLVHPYHLLGLHEYHYSWNAPQRAVQFTELNRRKKWEAVHGGLFDSVFFPLAKAVTIFRRPWLDQKNMTRKFVGLFVPAAVLKGPMYAVDVNATPLRPMAVEHETFVRELQTGNLQGHYAVDFVKQESLGDWLEAGPLRFAQSVAELASSKANLFLRNATAPGDEGYPEWVWNS